MAAMPADVSTPSAGGPRERVEYIKCQTPECRHNLGVQLHGGKVYWHVPNIVDFTERTTHITCPVCQAQRTWTADRRR